MTANYTTTFQIRERKGASRSTPSKVFAWSCWFWVLWVVFGSAPLPSWGQIFGGGSEPGLAVRLMVGFAPETPLFRKEIWTPIHLEVENFSQEVIEGRLVVVPYSEIDPPNRVRIEAPIQFAPRQKKLVRLLAQLPEWTEDINVFLEPQSRGRPLATVGVREMDESERLVVVLSDGIASYGGFAKESSNRDSSLHEITVHTLSRSDILPEMAQGYDLITLLVWDGLRLDEPTSGQQQALSDYLRLGGTLLLALGDRGDRLDQIGFRDFLPSIPRESKPFPTRGEISGLGSVDSGLAFSGKIHWESPGAGDSPMGAPAEGALLAAVGEFPGEPCVFLDGEPILYRQRMEAGWLLVSPLSFADWLKIGDAGRDFWRDLIESLPQHPPVFAPYLADFNVYLKTSLLGKLPSPWFIGGFLGLYTILVVPVNYLLFRNRKRLELAWLALPVLALLFSWLAYHIGALQQQSGVVQREIAVGFQPPGSAKARAQTLAAVYSPGRRVFDVEPAADSALPLPLVTEEFTYQQVNFDLLFHPDGKSGSYHAWIEPLLVHHWAANNVILDTVADLGGTLEAKAEQIGNDRFLITIENRTDYNLTETFVARYANWGSLGGVPSGASRVVEIDENRLSPFNPGQTYTAWAYPYGVRDFYRKSLGDFLIGTAAPMVAGLPMRMASGGKRVLDAYSPLGTRQLAFYLVALVEGSISPVSVNADLFAQEAASLLLVPIGVERTEGEILVQPTDWEVRLVEVDSNIQVFQGSVNLTYSLGQRQETLNVNPRIPLSFQYYGAPSPTEALTFSYHFGDRVGRIPPTSLSLQAAGPEILATSETADGRSGDPSELSSIPLECALYDLVREEWTKVGDSFEVQGEELLPFWDPNTQEIRLRGWIQGRADGGRWGRGQVRLPEITLTFGK